MKILVPTCRPPAELTDFRENVERNSPGCDVFISGLPASASVNRNRCLDEISIGDKAIMIDDDIDGFYPGWVPDLLWALTGDNVVMASARLLNPDCSFGPTCSRCMDALPEEIEVHSNGHCVIPSAAVAFVHRGHRFDESFLGSGWEDNDWCFQYLAADPGARFIQSNRCRLIHRNEMKSQGKFWKHNVMVFFTKWKSARATA